MNEQPHKSSEPTSVPNTTRSWRAMRLALCWICSLIAAISVLGCFYTDKSNQILRSRKEVTTVTDYLNATRTNTDYYPRGDIIPFVPGEILQYKYRYETRGWEEIQNDARKSLIGPILQGIGLGLLAGIGGWVGAWLLILIVAFIWWFILDRIREFARAVRGRQ